MHALGQSGRQTVFHRAIGRFVRVGSRASMTGNSPDCLEVAREGTCDTVDTDAGGGLARFLASEDTQSVSDRIRGAVVMSVSNQHGTIQKSVP